MDNLMLAFNDVQSRPKVGFAPEAANRERFLAVTRLVTRAKDHRRALTADNPALASELTFVGFLHLRSHRNVRSGSTYHG
jgi:hypothetical protein